MAAAADVEERRWNRVCFAFSPFLLNPLIFLDERNYGKLPLVF